MMKNWFLSLKTYTCIKARVQKPYPIYDQNGWKTIPFGTALACIASVSVAQPVKNGDFSILPARKMGWEQNTKEGAFCSQPIFCSGQTPNFLFFTCCATETLVMQTWAAHTHIAHIREFPPPPGNLHTRNQTTNGYPSFMEQLFWDALSQELIQVIQATWSADFCYC